MYILVFYVIVIWFANCKITLFLGDKLTNEPATIAPEVGRIMALFGIARFITTSEPMLAVTQSIEIVGGETIHSYVLHDGNSAEFTDGKHLVISGCSYALKVVKSQPLVGDASTVVSEATVWPHCRIYELEATLRAVLG